MRDYRPRHYRWQTKPKEANPFFDRQTKKGRYKIYLISGLLVLIVLIYGVLSSPLFLLTNIEVKGNIKITEQEINDLVNQQFAEKVWWLFNQQNYWLFNANELSQKLKQNYNLFSTEITKPGFHTLHINLQEQTASLILQIGESFYHLDYKGAAFEQINAADAVQTALPIVIVNTSATVAINSSPLDSNMQDFLLTLNRRLIQQNIGVKNYVLDSVTDREVKVQTTDGYYILFDIRQDVASQTNNLKLLLQDKIKDPKNLQYIDLRFGERIFYK
jgi:cell division septal protein FtsQ